MAGRDDTYRGLGRNARWYLAGVAVAAVAAVGAADLIQAAPPPDWPLLLVLVVLCLAGKALETFAPGHYALQPSYAAVVCGGLLLPAWATPILAFTCFAPDLRDGGVGGVAVYKTIFNIANYTLVGVLVAIVGGGGDVVGVTAATVVAAVANHGLIVVAIALAGEQPLRGTIGQLTDGLPLSVGVGLTGGVIALLWGVGPEWLVLALGPIGLLYRALWVPMLQHRADTDPKTGLYHSERIREELETQIGTGARVVVAMVDLDHLRTVNSRCGHLAGDRAIRAVADELAALAARYGAAGRFGGEEFCLVLPGVGSVRAAELLDGARERLRSVEFREAPDLRVSFSAGLAVFPDHGDSCDAVLTAADTALYDAKAAGRDRVRIALSPVAREMLALPPVHHEPAVQPLPATSAAGARLAAALAGGRRSGDRELERAEHDRDDALALVGRMQRTYLETITTLARALEDKDPFSAGATARVTAVALRLAEALGWGEADRQQLTLGVSLRDVGRAGTRDALVLENAELDPLEREELKRQADLAGKLVAELELPAAVKQMVRSHHERWDGTGYPDGLAGEDIPVGARLLAVAEAVDGMLSPRPWRDALTLAEAVAELAAGAGRRFCPDVAALAAVGLGETWGAELNVDVHVSKRRLDGAGTVHNASSENDVAAGVPAAH